MTPGESAETGAPANGGSGMGDLERTLVTTFGWSIYDIDQTDIESLIPFVNAFTGQGGAGAERVVYAEQVDWL